MAGARRIFGLSVTEEIEWAVGWAEPDPDRERYPEGQGKKRAPSLRDETVCGILSDIPTGNIPHPPDELVDIESLILDRLITLRIKKPNYFLDIEGIGVSTIGIANRDKRRLDSVARKNWWKPNADHIIDFQKIFRSRLDSGDLLFPKITSDNQIVVQNDASARCLIEYQYGRREQETFSNLLLIIAGEGVNAAFITNDDFLISRRHSEIGHIRPQLHPDDLKFDPHFSGCLSHNDCYEALISTSRMRQQWPDIGVFSPEHPVWPRLVSYLGQIAFFGVCTFSPDLIRFSGALFTGSCGLELIKNIHGSFLEFNKSYLPQYRTPQDAAALLKRAVYGKGGKTLSALAIGCLAAFPEDQELTVKDIVVDLNTMRTKR